MNQNLRFFISYTPEDSAYVTRLVDHLRRFDLPVWFDGQLRVGARFTQEADLAPGRSIAGKLCRYHLVRQALRTDKDQARDVATAGTAGRRGDPQFPASATGGVSGQRKPQVHLIGFAWSFLSALNATQGQVHHVGAGQDAPLRDDETHPCRAT